MGGRPMKLLLLLLLLALSSHGAKINSILQPAREVLSKPQQRHVIYDNVSVELYYESLCPYCARFIVNDLNKIFSSGLISIVNLRLIPYGNAKIKADGSITCQHGPTECSFNLIETCAINLLPAVSQHFPFIYCVEDLLIQGKEDLWPSCANKVGLNPKSISECYSSPVGLKWQLDFARETSELEPPHKFVPWVVVNEQPLYEDYEQVIQYICESYTGPKPDACTNAAFPTVDSSWYRTSFAFIRGM